jgi:phosphoribosylamine-glycine ligase
MKIAISSYSGLGAWFVLRLLSEGHDVDYYLSKPEYEEVLKGLIPKPKMLELDHRFHQQGYGFPSYKKYDLSLFDLTGRAKQADASRMEVPTLGDGSFEHMLEDDREFGIQAMESSGIEVPPYTRFDNPGEAKSFLKSSKKRYVFKPYTKGSTGQDSATTYVSKDCDDLLCYIDELWGDAKQAPFILQEFIEGTEIGTEAFFNGTDFFCLTGTLEEKKFMNDNKGPNTGCSGNLVFAMKEEAKIFKDGLLKARPMLSAAGFRGIIDLNTIVTKDKAYGLEWTPRFGYLCCPTISSMYGHGYADLLLSIASGEAPITKWKYKYGMATTLSIPPYPTEMRIPKAKYVPIEGIDFKNIEVLNHTFLYDAMVNGGKELCTGGNYGYVGAVLSPADSIGGAHELMNERLKEIQIPNCQYRTDIYSSTLKRYNTLEEDGWL